MAQITDEQKTNLQMVFNGLAKYFKALNLSDDYQKQVNGYMVNLWQIMKDYGTPESRTADTAESNKYWNDFVYRMNEIYEKYFAKEREEYGLRGIIRFVHWFMFDLIQITERWNGTAKHI